ncbi:hypothetical protein, conserved [Plasmodium gonderi]|uniref:Mitochondrial carrier protein n=1 Tax=Plasmodium gonderi TaxID=77519 RepID=A0A1Y1JDI0_PLAGO|nr:hypothetical protein, conserved [Plasmodium gonderi]GAW79267.1 hypothetical protein, conserved [Plasmodium gonderi]
MYRLLIFLLSILFINKAHVHAISTHEILVDKRIEFRNNAKLVINESYLVDKNDKLLGNSLRTYKYYLVKGTTEFRAIFIFDDLNMYKATELGINKEQHEVDILNIENNMNNIYPLDEMSTFNEVLYREKKMFTLETEYSTTTYVLAKFVFNVNVEEENEEDIMSLLIEVELNMKKKKLDIVKEEGDDNDAHHVDNNSYTDRQMNHSNTVELYKKKQPQVFTQFIGLLVSIASIVTSISGAISAVAPVFSGASSPSPPEFLGNEASSLPTYKERMVEKSETYNQMKNKKTENRKHYFDDYYGDEYYDDEYYDDEYYDDEYYDGEYYDGEYYDGEYYDGEYYDGENYNEGYYDRGY